MSQTALDPHDRNSLRREEATGLLENGGLNGSHEPKTQAESLSRQRAIAYLYAFCIVLLRQLQQLPDLLRNASGFLVPSFVRSRLSPKSTPPAPVYKTAYLDGLRGVASFLVFVFHMSAMVFHSVQTGYGYGEPGENRSFWQLPIIRLLHAGHPMVSLFFVVSGFALSIAPVKQMRRGDPDRTSLHRVLSSAVFRRPIRLFLPSYISTIVPFILLRLGINETTRAINREGTTLTGGFFVVMTAQETFGEEFRLWIANMWKLIDLNASALDFQPNNKYNEVLWTIPVEFRASVFLYLTHLGLSHLRQSVRWTITSALIVGAVCADRWDMILFWGGFLLAELDAWMSARDASSSSDEIGPDQAWSIFYWANFVMGLYVSSFPGLGAESTPGYRWLASLVPAVYTRKHRFWESVGSLQIVLAVSRLPALSSFFSRSIIRYLGQISFALYLVHWPIVSTIGVWVFYYVFQLIGRGTAFQTGLGWLICLVIVAAMSIWAADLFWRFVDIPCVKFGKWCEEKLIRKD